MQKSPFKVLTIAGTRPEVIRLSAIIPQLEKYFDHKLVHTNQNFDYELNGIFFDELGLRAPDYMLNCSGSLGNTLGQTLIQLEEVFLQEKPDAVVLLGDTNASIAGLLARRMKIKLYHLEAGNRAFDTNVPEEINRRFIDHIADFNLVYGEHARRNLLREGLEPRKIYISGSPLREVYELYKSNIQQSKVLESLGISSNKYYLASFHRAENVDDASRLQLLVDTLNTLAETSELPLIVSLHPRTRNRLQALAGFKWHGLVKCCKPFGFFDYMFLQQNARCVISDSGTVCEESAIAGFPAVTVRQSMERPEAMDCGSAVLAPVDKTAILNAVAMMESVSAGQPAQCPEAYCISDCSMRVVKLIAGTIRQEW
ncbi:MAG: UDP-N-acetylglucosamine 2-epimerase (non-hydrolyzing) [Lentisphaerae bacterium]|nr:UDP-N-acetylglucosamine 2-epimerase (non-hydrolyzing) [Lentisphaerota bacterium]